MSIIVSCYSYFLTPTIVFFLSAVFFIELYILAMQKKSNFQLPALQIKIRKIPIRNFGDLLSDKIEQPGLLQMFWIYNSCFVHQ